MLVYLSAKDLSGIWDLASGAKRLHQNRRFSIKRSFYQAAGLNRRPQAAPSGLKALHQPRRRSIRPEAFVWGGQGGGGGKVRGTIYEVRAIISYPASRIPHRGSCVPRLLRQLLVLFFSFWERIEKIRVGKNFPSCFLGGVAESRGDCASRQGCHLGRGRACPASWEGAQKFPLLTKTQVEKSGCIPGEGYRES